MQKPLWAPWRMEFLEDGKHRSRKECVFCSLPQENNDRENLIVFRGKHSFVILNRYPYNNGHLMVVPFLHTADFSAIALELMSEMQLLLQHCMFALKEKYHPAGFNLGMNLGEAGGAGIKEHLHWHVVPRWVGDTNFMPVLADTKSMPQHLLASYDLIFEHFRKVQL